MQYKPRKDTCSPLPGTTGSGFVCVDCEAYHDFTREDLVKLGYLKGDK